MTGTTKYVTTAALAKHFGVSAATIITMVRTGDIPAGTYTRMGRVFRYDLDRVEAALLDGAPAANVQLELDLNPDSVDEAEQLDMENDNE